MPETELASHIIAWLQDHQWEVYQEVSLHREGGIRADIVAKRDRIIWVIETKTTFGLQVLAQAWEWTRHAHFVSIAVPYRKQHNSSFAFERELFQQYGIGLIYVRTIGSSVDYDISITETYRPKFRRQVSLPELHERYKTYSQAGNNRCEFFTSFKETKENIINHVKKTGTIAYRDLIDKIDHHYRTPSAARACLAKYIGTHIIPELETYHAGNKLMVRLAGTTNDHHHPPVVSKIADDFAELNRSIQAFQAIQG